MRRAIPLGTLFALACVSILVPASTSAIPIHRHIYTEVDGRMVEKVKVINVAPRDSDKDGVANRKDDCPKTPGPGGCPPEPSASSSSGFVASAPATTSVAPSSAGGCPSSMAAESGSAGYGAVNPSSGAYGCYQILPSTAAAHGCDLSTPAGQDACAQTICGTEGSGAWAASGASPC